MTKETRDITERQEKKERKRKRKKKREKEQGDGRTDRVSKDEVSLGGGKTEGNDSAPLAASWCS